MTIRKLFAAVLCTALLLTGCASKSAGEVKDIRPGDAAGSLLESLTFQDSLILAEDGAAKNYYKLDENISEYAIYISGTGATAEEIAVLKTTDPKNVDKAVDILNKRLDDLRFRFEDYNPGEMVKLKDPVLVTGGNVAILVLSDDSAAAKKAAEQLLA